MKFPLIIENKEERDLLIDAFIAYSVDAANTVHPRESIHKALTNKIESISENFPHKFEVNRAYLTHLQNVLKTYILFHLMGQSKYKTEKEKINFLTNRKLTHNRIYSKLVTLGNDKNKLEDFAKALSSS